MSDGTAVARAPGADLPAEAGQGLRAMQQAGAMAVERQKVLNGITRQLAGLKWGEVSGSTLSAETRYAIAQLCQITGANPVVHIDILGGRPYFNSTFFAERMASDPHHINYLERNLSPSYEAELRRQAAEAEQDGDVEDTRRLRREARECARLRAHYGVPEWATHAYEGTVLRYTEGAPLAAIATGRVDSTPFRQEVKAANWCGGAPRRQKNNGQGTYDPDPIGNLEPGKTALTRTLRRAAKRAYPSFLSPEQEQQVKKIEEAVEAEFEIIRDDRQEARASLPADGEIPAVLTGGGEPAAARAVDAEPLPVEEIPAAAPRVPPNARAEARKFDAGCKALGYDPVEMFRMYLNKTSADTLEEYQKLNGILDTLADGEAGGDVLPEPGLGL